MAGLVAVKRALSVLELLARSPSGKSFGSIQQQLELSPSSLSRLLKMMIHEDWIATDSRRRYVISNRTSKLADLVNGRWSESEIVKPIVDNLAQSHGHSACFAKYANYGFFLIYKQEVASSYHFIDKWRVNEDLFSNEIGFVLLAHQHPEHRKEVVARCVPRNDIEGVHASLDLRRNQPLCEAQERHVRRIVAPVFAEGGTRAKNGPIGVVSVAILDPAGAPAPEELRKDVLAASNEISRQFELYPMQDLNPNPIKVGSM